MLIYNAVREEETTVANIQHYYRNLYSIIIIVTQNTVRKPLTGYMNLGYDYSMPYLHKLCCQDVWQKVYLVYGGPGGHSSFIPVAISIILVATSVSPVATSVIKPSIQYIIITMVKVNSAVNG